MVLASAPEPSSSGHVLLGYARVSTTGQVTDRQMDALEAAGCDRIFVDHGVSGKTMSRPEFDKLLDFARAGDSIVVHSLDRLGRRAGPLLVLIDELHGRGVSLRILTLDVDTRSPLGALVLGVVASLAQAEAEILSERVRSGLQSARERGRVGGRPRVLSEAQREAALAMLNAGRRQKDVAEIFEVSERTIRRLKAAGESSE